MLRQTASSPLRALFQHLLDHLDSHTLYRKNSDKLLAIHIRYIYTFEVGSVTIYIICILQCFPYDDLDKMARRGAGLTHYDATAGLCSSVLVRLLRRFLSGGKLSDAAIAVSSDD